MGGRLPILLALLLLLGLRSDLLALDKDEQKLLELVQNGHRAAVGSIRTFSCQVVRTQGSATTTGRYWRSLDAVRAQVDDANGSRDFLIRGGQLSLIGRGRDPAGGPVVNASIKPWDSVVPIDPWLLGQLTFFSYTEGRGLSTLSFDDILAGEHKVRQIKRVTQGGRELVYVELSRDHFAPYDFELQLWFDPKVNYLVRRAVRTLPKRKHRNEYEVIRFKEVAPAIYFPERVENHGQPSNSPPYKETATFSDIQVNPPLPPDTFKLRYPHGTNMHDLVRGEIYKVDADGKRIGPATDRHGNPLQMSKEPPLQVTSAPQKQTQEEPQPATRWLLPGSIVVFGLAGAFWLVRRWSQRPQHVTP